MNNFANQNNFSKNTMYNSQMPMQPINYIPSEQSYIENILRLNRGKNVDIYASYPDSDEWRNKIFSGIVEQSGRDHIILSDPKTGNWYLILLIYINFIKFDERITSDPEFYPNNWIKFGYLL